MLNVHQKKSVYLKLDLFSSKIDFKLRKKMNLKILVLWMKDTEQYYI